MGAVERRGFLSCFECQFPSFGKKIPVLEKAVKVEPITEMKDIRSIKKMLRSNPRDYLLFIMGINSGLRVQDMLK